jgi:preprotein translocase subunit SecD
MPVRTFRFFARVLVPASLLALAACQSVPVKKPAAAAAAPTDSTVQASRQGAPVAVYLADTAVRSDWTAVQIHDGTLYVNPKPVLTRNDLSGIKAGSNKNGDGLLALDLNDAGQKKVNAITTQNPNKRLALVVGRTMMAAPTYSVPVNTHQLVFPVGTEQNAVAAARAIAGTDAVPDAPAKAQPAPAAARSTAPASKPAR